MGANTQLVAISHSASSSIEVAQDNECVPRRTLGAWGTCPSTVAPNAPCGTIHRGARVRAPRYQETRIFGDARLPSCRMWTRCGSGGGGASGAGAFASPTASGRLRKVLGSTSRNWGPKRGW
ncbi:hypothetical protein GWK47_025232 [Chionoecetes opilio]|uniref:Uncharacterized protein n=1 Tax=Chionoecetes opilio TaxID=41210 RepID=A0A8J4XKL4_CHIOP|nr:hypothetical protein GWK47_025232 [Chionoecetes opilio]